MYVCMFVCMDGCVGMDVWPVHLGREGHPLGVGVPGTEDDAVITGIDHLIARYPGG